MLKIEDVRIFLCEKNRDYIHDVRLRPSDQVVLVYVLRDKVADKVRPGFTSLSQLKRLKSDMHEKFSTPTEIILVDSESLQQLEAGFYRLLNRRFYDQIVSFSILFNDGGLIDSWMEVVDLDEEIKSQINVYYKELLEGAALSIGHIEWTNSLNNLPTNPIILRLIKTQQPINLNGLLEIVFENHRSVNGKWLNHKLDFFRRKGLIIRLKTGGYVLSSQGLKAIPAGARHTSSDIDRVLALGRKKW